MCMQVRGMLGHAVGPDEPLMASGLDSRAAMELRATLADELGISLPVTLLYDAQVKAAAG
jgi:acyl carrier protein